MAIWTSLPSGSTGASRTAGESCSTVLSSKPSPWSQQLTRRSSGPPRRTGPETTTHWGYLSEIDTPLGVIQATFPVALLVAQVVQVSHGDRGQPLVLRLTVVLVLALENAPGGRSTQGFVGLIDGGQQFDIGAGIALREAVPSIAGGLEFAVGPIASDQPRHLGPAQAGHLLQVAPHQAAGFAALFLIVLLAQNLLHPAVSLLAIFAFELDLFAGV